MATYRLVPNCTVDDAVGLANSNMTAFYGEPWWNMNWDKPLDAIIESATARMPTNLLKERDVRRQQKVIDTATGQIVGYARWILPASHADSWLDAQVPDVSEQDKARFQAAYEAVDWAIRPEVEGSDDLVVEQFHKHAPKGPYISKHYPFVLQRLVAEGKIELDYLGVHPDHHRRGIGSMLVKSGVEQGNQLGIDLYMMAMGQKAVDMYTRQGFEELDSLKQDMAQWGREGSYDTWILVKHPETK